MNTSIFRNFKFACTGSLPVDRLQIRELIFDRGGSYSEKVTQDLDYLIAGSDAGSKELKAQALNIKIITWNQFLALAEVDHVEK